MINNDNDVEWILIEDKIKKEWKKRNANKEEKKEDKKIIYIKDYRSKSRMGNPSLKKRKRIIMLFGKYLTIYTLKINILNWKI